MTLLIAGLIGGAGAGMLAGCALTLRSRAFGNFSAALALSACTPPHRATACWSTMLSIAVRK